MVTKVLLWLIDEVQISVLYYYMDYNAVSVILNFGRYYENPIPICSTSHDLA